MVSLKKRFIFTKYTVYKLIIDIVLKQECKKFVKSFCCKDCMQSRSREVNQVISNDANAIASNPAER